MNKRITYMNKINTLGQISSIIVLIGMFMIPIGTAFYFGIEFNIMDTLAASTSLIALFLPTAVIENISFYPILGSGAMYLSSVTGNITNLKLPAAVSGHQIAGVETGRDEGDLIAILAVGMSSLVQITILLLGMFVIGQWLLPILNHPTLEAGFNNITPALLGAITIPQVFQHKKLSVIPVVIGIISYLYFGPERFPYVQSYVLLTVMIISITAAYMMYKYGKLNDYQK